MPAGQPFTSLCQLLGRGPHAGRADLHLHTTYSDGSYTPAEIVDLASRCGLSAIAITDHDTFGGVTPARKAAAGSGVEVICASELSCEFHGRELHALAYFVDSENVQLTQALAQVRRDRADRFREIIERLRTCGVSIEGEGKSCPACKEPEALGRRYLAELLVEQGAVGSVREAFQRYLGDGGRADVPKKRLPAAKALALIRGAGGVAAWAHPSYDCTRESLADLRGQGLGAIEVEYPETKPSRVRELRQWAADLGLAVTGGSDCHGPGRRSVGACTISADELSKLRSMASR
jgi:predicted metal-dependent phosphoesterase TrpH